VDHCNCLARVAVSIVNIARGIVPGIAVVGISLVLAVGFDRVMRLGSDVESDAAITSAVAHTPDTLAGLVESSDLAQATTAVGVPSQPSPFVSVSRMSVSRVQSDSSVCVSTEVAAQAGDAPNVARNAIAIDASSGQLDPDFVIDAVSSAAPLVGSTGSRPQHPPRTI
jgi:hypothetical protein